MFPFLSEVIVDTQNGGYEAGKEFQLIPSKLNKSISGELFEAAIPQIFPFQSDANFKNPLITQS